MERNANIERESGHCPTCGQRVGTFTADDGTSYYLATAEQEASELGFVRDQLAGAVDLLREIGRAANTQDAIPDEANVRVPVPLRLVRAARATGGQ